MSDAALIHPLIRAINENQLALESAINELLGWIERQGGIEASRNARAALEPISRNEAFIKISLMLLESKD